LQPDQSSKPHRIFCSYSSADRVRVNGLALLLEALGHDVFIDHKTIKPGARWEAKLQNGLDQADMLIVFWTRNSSQSDWVRKEIEYFHTHFPDYPIVPMLGDDTPLSELLSAYQHSDFLPFINELLELKRSMEKQGAKPAQIQEKILQRLEESGIEIKSRDRNKLMGLFAATGIMGLFATPGVYLNSLFNQMTQTVAQTTWGQGALLAAAAISGAVVCHMASDSSSPESDTAVNDTAVTPEKAHTQDDKSTVDLVSPEQAEVDKWLGSWTGKTQYANNQQGDIWIKVSRNCDTYSIETNAAEASELTILGLNSETIKFIDQIGTEVEVSKTGEDTANASIRHPDAIAQLGIQQNTSAVFEKTESDKPMPCLR